MKASLVSVVVPVYKVEKYLDRAVTSLLGQTYRNLEIILVDDGSPDRCPEMCDDFARLDSRVKVLHQNNRGVSAARNSGLDIVTGQYLTFLDSDDYLDAGAIETMVSKLESTNADVVCCGSVIVDECENVCGYNKCDNEIEATGPDVAKMMLSDVFPYNFSWGKLFKKSLFDGIRYPKGRIYEDNATTYRAVAKAERVVCIPDCLYRYFRSREGNTTSELSSDKAAWSYYCGCVNCTEFISFCSRNKEFHDVVPSIHRFLFAWSKLCIESAIKMGWDAYADYCRKVENILFETGVDVPMRLKAILLFRRLYFYVYPIIGRHR